MLSWVLFRIFVCNGDEDMHKKLSEMTGVKKLETRISRKCLTN